MAKQLFIAELLPVYLLEKIDEHNQSSHNKHTGNVSYLIGFAINLQVFAEGKEIIDGKAANNYPKKPADMMRVETQSFTSRNNYKVGDNKLYRFGRIFVVLPAFKKALSCQHYFTSS